MTNKIATPRALTAVLTGLLLVVGLLAQAIPDTEVQTPQEGCSSTPHTFQTVMQTILVNSAG